MTEQVCVLQPWSCSQTAWSPARALQHPGPAPEQFSLGSHTTSSSPAAGHSGGHCHAARCVGESQLPPPPSQSRHRAVQLPANPHPTSFPASALLAGSGNLGGLQQRIWQADLSQFFPVQTNVVNWFTKHFILFTVLLPFFE